MDSLHTRTHYEDEVAQVREGVPLETTETWRLRDDRGPKDRDASSSRPASPGGLWRGTRPAASRRVVTTLQLSTLPRISLSLPELITRQDDPSLVQQLS